LMMPRKHTIVETTRLRIDFWNWPSRRPRLVQTRHMYEGNVPQDMPRPGSGFARPRNRRPTQYNLGVMYANARGFLRVTPRR
jgi:hypothetical protein